MSGLVFLFTKYNIFSKIILVNNMENILSIIDAEKKGIKFFSLLVGCFMAAIAYNFVFVPHNMIVGGVTGMAVIAKALWGINTTIFIDVVDVLFIILSFIIIGKKDTMAHIIGSITFPIMVTLTSPLTKYIKLDFGSDFLMILIAAIVYGLASGLIFRAGYTSGGTDIIIDIISRKAKKTVTSLGIVVNGIIILCGGIVFSPIKIMYAILIVYVSNRMAAVVLFGVSSKKMIYVISKKNKDIEKYIMEDIHTGATEINVVSGLFEKKKQMLMCVVHAANYRAFKHNILKMDPNAFIVVNNCYEVSGGVKYSLLPF